MNFYTDPSFFLIAGILCIPAIILHMLQRPAKTYGLAATLIMLALLFGQDLTGAASLIFFAAYSTLLAYMVLKLFEKKRRHAIGLYRIALAASILPLVFVKVSALVDLSLFGFIGISYITFKSVQVIIEIRDGLIKEIKLVDLLYFLLFFPVFTSGPIMRSRDFIKQLNKQLKRDEYLDLVSKGVLWLLKGLLYSFVLAGIFQWLMWFAPSALSNQTLLDQTLAQITYAFSYGLYLFFNFAGYSLMAMAFGAFFGIKVPWNFKAPFRSIDIKDFWNRWHITLSFWLRDYVFMRLSKSFIKHKTFESRTTTACAGFIIEMVLMGCWHGLTPSYIAYGLFHGLLLAGCELFQKKSQFYKQHKNSSWFKFCSWAFTMICVFFGFALFSGQVCGLILPA